MSSIRSVIKNISEKKKFKKKKKVKSPLIVVKKELSENLDDVKIKEWLSTIEGFIEGLTKVNDKNTKLYDYQIAYFRNKSKFRIANKSRQIGWSFGIAAESLAKSQLCDNNTSIFISYNQEEANEKILAVKMLYDSIPLAYQKKRVTDNKHSQIFKNSRGQITRIISTAQRSPRGKGYNTDVYFDEFAFWQFADKIFTASAPVITRGTGVLTIGSTPLGARGKFYEILTHTQSYPQFSRQNVPWWHCPDLCSDIEKAYKSKNMTTIERVERYARETLKVIFESMPLDDFQQEYELAFIDENVSYFPVTIVNKCIYPISVDEFNYDEIKDNKGLSVTIGKAEKNEIELKYPKIKFFMCNSVEEFIFKVNSGEIRPTLLAGFDVGRRKDKSELIVIEEIPLDNDEFLHIVRFKYQFDRKPFEEQRSFLKMLMNSTPCRMAIDSMGIGMNLAENMHNDFPGRVDMIAIEAEWKDRAAQSLKIRFENQLLAIPDDEQLKRQIGSIKKKVSSSGYVRYDAEKDKEHHGDKLWALALASMLGHEVYTKETKINSNIVESSRVFKNKDLPKNKIPVVYLPQDGGIDMPGVGLLPPPIPGALDAPRTLVDQWGNTSWPMLSSAFHTLIKRG